MELGSRLVDSQVKPLTNLKNVEQIYIVRNEPGPKLKKVTYFNLPKFITKLKFGNIIYKKLFLPKLITKTNPKLIVAFYLVPHGLIAFLSAKLTGKPICLSLIGTDLNLHCKKKIIGRILIWLIKGADIITVPGSLSQQFLIERGVPSSKLFVLPNTIDTTEFHPTSRPKQYEIVTIGRLVEGKHIEILLKIISKLKQKTTDIKVGIAGSGPLREQLEKLSAKLKLENNIEFLGYVNDSNNFINSGKIYVLTSESEGLPTAMIEAMACGLPSVVPNVGNISDVIVNGENGFIINDYRDVNGYVDAISKLLKDDSLYKKVQKNAIEVRNKYSVENASRIWKKIISKLQLS
jgi:glycosyltransferase involved in cell wall biosynthesis